MKLTKVEGRFEGLRLAPEVPRWAEAKPHRGGDQQSLGRTGGPRRRILPKGRSDSQLVHLKLYSNYLP